MRSRKDSNMSNSINQQTSKIKKEEISIYLSIITLNVNSFSLPIKRYRLAKWIKK
jgi:hypothetical protein